MTNFWANKSGGRGTAERGRTARVGALLGIPGLLETFGLQLAPLLEEAGLECDALQDPENRVAVDCIVRLLMLCAEKSGRASFGLLLGQDVQPAALGAVAQLLLGAPSVERALRGLILNLHLNGEAVVPTLTVIEDTARLSLTPYAYHPNGASQLEDLTLAVTTNILRFLCGPRWSADGVALAHREPTDRRAYDEFFKAPVQFGAELTVLKIPVYMARETSRHGPGCPSAHAAGCRLGDGIQGSGYRDPGQASGRRVDRPGKYRG